MVRKIIFFVLILHVSFKLTAQNISHYFTYIPINFNAYFVTDKAQLNYNTIRAKIQFPSFNYKVEYSRYGLEFFYVSSYTYYNPIQFDKVPDPDNTFSSVINHNLGIALHYNVIDEKWVKINTHFGIVRNKYDADLISGWITRGSGTTGRWYEPILNYESESKTGGLLGINVLFPIYKNFHVHSNLRYLFFPTANYNKQNFILELGIGYRMSYRIYENK